MRINYKDIEDEKLWIWGCGKAFHNYINQIPSELNIVGICDGDANKIGGEIELCGRRYVIASPGELSRDEAVIVSIEDPDILSVVVGKLDDIGIKWCHIYEVADSYMIGQNIEYEYRAIEQDKIVKFIDCQVNVDYCNLRCDYCYLRQMNYEYGRRYSPLHSAEYIRKAFSKERLGGICYINFCGVGETLLFHELYDIVKELTSEGHYVQIVTNATIKKEIDRYIDSDMDLSKVFFKCSLHYEQLLKRNLLDLFADNVKRLMQTDISVSVEIIPDDASVVYIDDIKNYCLNNFGALPHVSVERDSGKEDRRVCTKYSMQEYRKIWSVFDSELFVCKLEHLENQGYHYCNAGIVSGELSLTNGDLYSCIMNESLGNFYNDFSKDPFNNAVGWKCGSPYCHNCHAFLTFGCVSDQMTCTYLNIRDRIDKNGNHWIKSQMRNIMAQRLTGNVHCNDKHKGQMNIEEKIYALTKGFGNNLGCVVMADENSLDEISDSLERAGHTVDAGVKCNSNNIDESVVKKILDDYPNDEIVLIDGSCANECMKLLHRLKCPREKIFYNADYVDGKNEDTFFN